MYYYYFYYYEFTLFLQLNHTRAYYNMNPKQKNTPSNLKFKESGKFASKFTSPRQTY